MVLANGKHPKVNIQELMKKLKLKNNEIEDVIIWEEERRYPEKGGAPFGRNQIINAVHRFGHCPQSDVHVSPCTRRLARRPDRSAYIKRRADIHHASPEPARLATLRRRRRRHGGRRRWRHRLPRPARLPRRHRRLEVLDFRHGNGDRRAVRVQGRGGEPHHVPHGAAGPADGARGGVHRRVEGRLPDAAAAGGLRRRRLARPVPGYHPRLRPLRREHGHAVAVVGVPHLPVRRARGRLLRRALPGGAGRGRAQAVRPGVRGGPVRREGPQGERGEELLLQLVVLRHVRRHRRHNHGLQLRPGQRRLGPRLWHPLHRHRRLPRRLPHWHSVLPLLHHQGAQPRSPRRQGALGAYQELEIKAPHQSGERQGGGQELRRPRGGGEERLPPAANLGVLHNLRHHLLPDVHLLHQAGGHAGPADRRQVQGAAGGAADLHQRHHRGLHPGVRPPLRAARAPLHGAAHGHHHAAEGRGRAVPLPRRRRALGPRGDEAARRRQGRRPGGRPQGAAPDDALVDGAAVRPHRRLRRVRHDRPAGVLLRPGARRRAQPRPRALPQHLRRGPPPQQLPYLRHRQGDGEARRQLVLQQPQPRAPRLLLLAARRALRPGARRILLLLASVCLQEEERRWRGQWRLQGS